MASDSHKWVVFQLNPTQWECSICGVIRNGSSEGKTCDIRFARMQTAKVTERKEAPVNDRD